MKLDMKLLTGIFIGIVVGLHYHGVLLVYLPILMIVSLILVLKMVQH